MNLAFKISRLTAFECGRIIVYRDQGFSIRKIKDLTNISRSTISNFLKIYDEIEENIERKKGS
jgi:predicted DNA-binding protein YlxM (UPF0122 family)